MATVTTNYAGPSSEATASKTDRVTTILQWTYGLVPIVAGADKFSHILTDWNQYLAPIVTDVQSRTSRAAAAAPTSSACARVSVPK